MTKQDRPFLKRILCTALCAALSLSLFAFPANAEEPEDDDTSKTEEPVVTGPFDPNTSKVWSEAVYMVNYDTGDVVYKKNETKKMYPASTTKIMTCIVALDHITSMSKKVDVPYECFDEFYGDDENKWYPSNAAIEPLQSNVTYKDCLYALMLPSACEAANILAYNIGGKNMKKFIDMMNQKAAEIGCTGTHFSNAHGLFEEENYTTAEDLYKITKYAYENYPVFMDICDTYEYEMPANDANPDGYSIFSTVSLIKPSSMYYYQYAHGVKTGTIDQSGRCLASTATNKYTYILVTLGAPIYDKDGVEYDDWYSMVDHINLYDWAFDTFEMKTLITKTEQITEIPVTLGDNATHVVLTPQREYSALMPKTIDENSVQKVFKTYESVDAPVNKGAVLGVMDVKFKGETITTVNLVASSDVSRSQFDYYMRRVSQQLDETWFKACVIGAIALIVCFIVSKSIELANKRKQDSKKQKRYKNYGKM